MEMSLATVISAVLVVLVKGRIIPPVVDTECGLVSGSLHFV